MILTGGCHCGSVRFEVETEADLIAYDCNCSLCSMTGFLHLIVPAARFRLVKGAETLTTYQFNLKIAKHLFCRVCGIKSFYVPRSNPNGFSVNVRCLDHVDTAVIKILPFDGKNWESAEDLSALTKT
jgi:hypothetical protein